MTFGGRRWKKHQRPSDKRIAWIAQAHPDASIHFVPIKHGSDNVVLLPTTGSEPDWFREPPVDAKGKVKVETFLAEMFIPKAHCLTASNVSVCREYYYDILLPDNLTGVIRGYQDSKKDSTTLWREDLSALCKPLK